MAELRNLPKIDVLAGSAVIQSFPEGVRVQAARAVVARARAEALEGKAVSPSFDEALLAEAVKLSGTSLRRIINGSGVVLHTGIGRARLSVEAAKAVHQTALHHAAVEFDIESGLRGDRQVHVRSMLTELTGAADAHVVNNCAAGVLLALTALCHGKGVLLSRGQMVEIGGSFRMPDIVRSTGCRLIEVGCTNKTRISDYQPDGGEIAAILRCHPSNFKQIGFVEEPTPAELAEHAHRNGWLMIDDVGSGTLVDTSAYGLPKEPTLQESLRAGADVVLSSGDKMLGGPQAGIILGSKECIARIRSHPFARAVRIDKLTLAALEATLRLLVQGRQDEIPTLRYMAKPAETVRRDARRLASAYPGKAVVETGLTEIGGGSAPGTGIPTWRVGLQAPSAADLAAWLRSASPAVLGRIERNIVWLDPRTMDADDVRDACQVLKRFAEQA